MRWLTLLLLLVMGCAGPMQLRGPTVSGTVQSNGVHGQVDTHFGYNLHQFLPPGLEYRTRYNSWPAVDGDWIDMPDSESGILLRLALNGRTVEASGNYDGVSFDIRGPNWEFWLRNNGDGGVHPLYITIRYANIGQRELTYSNPETLPFRVYNTRIRRQ